MRKSITFTVNGEQRQLEVEPRRTLLHVLRHDLGLTGIKEGCSNGNCGSCTMILNGQAVNACLVLAVEVDGSEVLTIEGLAQDGKLHPLQRAFIEHGAIQCGFCTPGMIMAAKAFLDRHPNPSPEEIKHALTGNLCRCTGYGPIIAAVLSVSHPGGRKESAAGGRPSADVEGEASRWIGRSVPRKDGVEKVTGAARYAADIRIPGMLEGKILFSRYSHARILRVDARKALELPGVRAVVTGDDLPDYPYGLRGDRLALARGKVLFSGDKVAAVAAEDAGTAEKALALIEVEYRPLPPALDPQEAMRPDAPVVHSELAGLRDFEDAELGPNVAGRTLCSVGDVEQGFAEADLIFEDTFVTQRAHQAYLEPHASLALVDEAGHVTLWTSAQGPFWVRAQVAQALGIPEKSIQVIPTTLGGGFGGKIDPLLEPVCVLLARKAGRPVRMALTRREEFISAQTRGRTVLYLKTGVKRDGRLVAREGRFLYDMGAHGDDSEGLTYLGQGPYRIPHLKLVGLSVYTNHISSSPFRAPKVPQLTFAGECQMDRIATALGMDPLDIRRKNAIQEGDLWANEAVAGPSGLLEVLERGADHAGWSTRSRGRTPDGKLIGWGMACAPWPVWMSSTSTAEVLINEDGSVTVVTGSVDMTGTHTALAQIVAEELGVDLEAVSVTTGDTSTVPFSDTTGGSRVTSVTGMAVLRAAVEARQQLFEMYAELTGASPDVLEAREGCVKVRGSPDPGLRIGELARACREAGYGLVRESGQAAHLPPAMAFAAQIAQVEVHPGTGRVRVLRLVAAQDVGCAINPALVKGQIAGGATQGIGFGLLEEHVTQDGYVLNPTFLDYHLPTTLDVPQLETVIVDGPPSGGPYGARGVGEPPICPTAAAIANAVYDAIGMQIKELPLTPERVLAALQGRH